MPNMKSFPRKTLETIAKESTPRGKAAREELAKMVDKQPVKEDTKKPVQKRTRKTTTKKED